MKSVVLSFLDQYLVIASILFVCGDTFPTCFFNAALFLILFNIAHVLGKSLDKNRKSTKNDGKNSDEANTSSGDDEDDEKESSSVTITKLFDPDQSQYPEVYATFVGCAMFSVGAVLDWREPWTEFPYLSLYGGLGLCLVVHFIRRVVG